MSTRPSPLMSPAPIPCAAYVPASLTCGGIPVPVGLAGSGFAHRNAPPLPYTRSGLPSPSTSFMTEISACEAGGMMLANMSQRRDSPLGFTYSLLPDVDASSTSGQPSPVKSPANATQLNENSVEGLKVWAA